MSKTGTDWAGEALRIGTAAREASRRLSTTDAATRATALRRAADAMRDHARTIVDANAADVEAAKSAGLAAPLVARLTLTEKKVGAMADSVVAIAGQPDPVGQVIDAHVRPDGLRVQRLRVPLGVVLFVYESRPNVTSDAAALCLKSGNAVVLRGGKEAIHSNRAIAAAVVEGLASADVDPNAVQLVGSTDRALVPELLKLDRHIDLVIPRGGEGLIRAVVKESTIPVLKHYTGNCHIYVDAATDGMDEQIARVCLNAKTSYTAACNAVEKLLFHRSAAGRLLPLVCGELAKHGVQVRGDDATRTLFPAAIAATEEDWSTEYLSLTVAVKVVDTTAEAIRHINEFGSHHTDAILSHDPAAIDAFVQQVDSASVMVNASTRFADGGEYGLGAEIGISTDKLHARGPMGAADLTTYKWVVTGNGHVRV
jgi:glutamate-5-semialdehyde dehydrogenase